MPNYEVIFEMDIAETVMIQADSLEDAQEEVRDKGWWRLSKGNWEITKQYNYIEKVEFYCTKCLAEFGEASLGCNVTIVAQDECISCQTFEVIEVKQNES